MSALVRCRLFIVVLLFAACCALPSAASASTYSASSTTAVPPASAFSGSAGGDGWSVTLSSTAEYNVFHHGYAMYVNCRLQSNGQPCWPTNPERIYDTATGSNYTTSGHPGTYLDQATGKLYIYGTRSSNNTAGVVCFDTTQAATNTNPNCGFTPLSAPGQAGNLGWSAVGAPMLVGTKWYAFNYDGGATAGTGGPLSTQNTVMCFDTSTDAACGGQPYALNFGGGSVYNYGPSPATAAIGTRLMIPVGGSAGPRLACFDTTTNASCAGSWPAPIPGIAYYGGPFPLLDTSGNVIGACLPNGADSCFSLTGSPVAQPAGLGSVTGSSDSWNGPGVTIGTRVYVPNGNMYGNRGAVTCYDYSKSAGCAGFPKTFGSGTSDLYYLYTVNTDPQRPTCLWVNADSGAHQIQNFDAFTGGACGSGATRVLASSFVVTSNVPTGECYPYSYRSLQVTSPSPGQYTSAAVQINDGGGNPIAGIPTQTLDSNGNLDLSGLGITNTNGLPQFVLTFNGLTAGVNQVTTKLTWTADYKPACVSGGQHVDAQPTSVSGTLSGGGQTGANLHVVPGAAVSDTASLTGTNAAAAGGSVTYAWYSDNTCQTAFGSPITQSIATPGTMPSSGAVSFPTPGTYYELITYSGDAGNFGSHTNCGDETVAVGVPTPAITSVAGGPTPWVTNGPVTITGTAFPNSTITLFGTSSGGATSTPVTVAVDASGAWTAVSTVPGLGLSDGSWSFDATDSIGGVTSSLSPSAGPLLVDTAAPATVDDAPAGWQTSAVTVHLTATDTGSGVAATYYVLDGAPTQAGTSVPITGDGVHNLTYWSVDFAGNAETPHLTTVSIDTTAPVTSDNAPSGWQHQDVSFNLVAGDGTGSGVAATFWSVDGGAQQVGNTVTVPASLGDGVHDVSYYSVDSAGNQEKPHTVYVFIDTTPPVTADDAPAQWVNHDVTVHLTPSDGSGSGIASTFYKIDSGSYQPGTAVSVPTSLGDGAHTITYYSVDNAGNQELPHSTTVSIDTTPPVTTDDAPSGWLGGPVTVHLTPSDGGSGVAGTFYTVDGGPQQTGTAVALSGDGVHTVIYYSVDNAGNQEAVTTRTVKIDSTPPVTTDDAPSGWQNGPVTVHLNPSDAGSGVAGTFYTVDGGSQQAGTTVALTGDGVHTISYHSVDNVGNTEAVHTATVKIDTTPPATTDDAPNSWQNQDVTVHLSPSDGNGSGVASTHYSVDGGPDQIGTAASIPAPANGSNDGPHTISYYSVDNVGNKETAHTATVKIDTTPPVTTDDAPSGWQNHDVTVHLNASDGAGSGVASTHYSVDGGPDQTGTTVTVPASIGEGPHTVSYYSVDNAGNRETAHTATVKIDTTPPVTTDDAPSGWVNHDVTVHLAASDGNGSGVAATHYSVDGGPDQTGASVSIPASLGDGAHTIAYYSVDNVGNREKAHTATVRIDTTPPQTTAAGVPAGWVNHAVTISLNPSDPSPGSGVAATMFSVDGGPAQQGTAVAIPAPAGHSGDGTHTVSYWSLDNAGNAEKKNTATVRIDTVSPTITFGGGYADGGFAAAGGPAQVAIADPNDPHGSPGSGIDGSQTTYTLDGAAYTPGSAITGLGPHTLVVGVCDKAGNCVTATSKFTVFAFATGGSFVVGDKTVGDVSKATGEKVTYWGSQWSSLNQLSGGSAPASFKGFESSTAAPVCGTAWTTTPGNSAGPSQTVPSYMAVIVSSTITKSGSSITGDDQHIVVVKTDSGYGPDPGHAGTGTILGTAHC